MRILLTDLIEKSKSRPSGYYDDVTSNGTIDGNYLIIDSTKYEDLLRKYGNSNTPCSACKSNNNIINNNKKMPSLRVVANNAVNAAVRVANNIIANKQVFADDSTVENRKSICNNCEFLNTEKQRCSKCGCYYKTKIKLQSETCPINKW
mgnify:CR=1 FL=1